MSPLSPWVLSLTCPRITCNQSSTASFLFICSPSLLLLLLAVAVPLLIFNHCHPSSHLQSVIVTPLLTFNQSLSPLFSLSISHCHPSSHLQSLSPPFSPSISHCCPSSNLQSVTAIPLPTFKLSLPSLKSPSISQCHPSNHLQSVIAVPQITFNQSLPSLKSPSISHCCPSNHLQLLPSLKSPSISHCCPSNHLPSAIAILQITFNQSLLSLKSPSVSYRWPSNHLQSVPTVPFLISSHLQSLLPLKSPVTAAPSLTCNLSLLLGGEDALHPAKVHHDEALGLQELVVGHLPRLLQHLMGLLLFLQQPTHWNIWPVLREAMFFSPPSVHQSLFSTTPFPLCSMPTHPHRSQCFWIFKKWCTQSPQENTESGITVPGISQSPSKSFASINGHTEATQIFTYSTYHQSCTVHWVWQEADSKGTSYEKVMPHPTLPHWGTFTENRNHLGTHLHGALCELCPCPPAEHFSAWWARPHTSPDPFWLPSPPWQSSAACRSVQPDVTGDKDKGVPQFINTHLQVQSGSILPFKRLNCPPAQTGFGSGRSRQPLPPPPHPSTAVVYKQLHGWQP